MLIRPWMRRRDPIQGAIWNQGSTVVDRGIQETKPYSKNIIIININRRKYKYKYNTDANRGDQLLTPRSWRSSGPLPLPALRVFSKPFLLFSPRSLFPLDSIFKGPLVS